MSGHPEQLGRVTEMADYTARGVASEAMMLVREAEKINVERFGRVTDGYKELKSTINEVKAECAEIRAELKNDIANVQTTLNEGFKSYDGKFWSLAVTVILTLIGGLATTVWYLLIHHP